MDNTPRRLYLNNWAILAAENEALWHFGDIDEQKRIQTLSFIDALSKLGSEILGQGIGTIRLRYPRPHPTQAREIMVVNLLDRYSLVVSDPLVTTRLFRKIEVESGPPPPWNEMRSILAGGAAVIYSEFYSHEEIISRSVVDSLFQEAVNAVTVDEDVYVGEGQCSFSALTLEELLFFHSLLKELFESYISTTQPGQAWGIISDIAGSPIYLETDIPGDTDSALLSGFSSVIVNYTQMLFQASPARLVFGSHSISGMDFIVTDDNLFILNNPRKLLKLQRFLRAWKKIPPKVAHDLAPAMKEYCAELAIIEHRERIKNLEFHRVINETTGMGIRRARKYRLPKLR